MRPATPMRRRGFTLIEAILAIVVIGVGMTGLMSSVSVVSRNSADPVVRKQMLAIAQEMLEEIQLKPYAAAANAAPTGCGRDTYNDLLDYNGYSSTGICSIDGVVIPALAKFNASVSVAAGTVGGVGAARRIVVSVSLGNDSLQLVGWRTDFASP